MRASLLTAARQHFTGRALHNRGRRAAVKGEHVGSQGLLFFQALRKPPGELLESVFRWRRLKAPCGPRLPLPLIWRRAPRFQAPPSRGSRGSVGQAPEGAPVVTVSLGSAS